ncbi:MAG TPA: MFS transporter [Polyangia bacterium]|jgi:MFS family permease
MATAAAPGAAPAPARRLPPTVVALGVVSLLTDAASEMIYPLLPALIISLGGGPAFLGLIEGVAESTAAFLKLGSGVLTDRRRTRKPLVVAGYAIASVLRPLVAFATAPWHVLAVRFGDRIGKGLRASPRDALLAAAAPPGRRGLAFGFHRAMDHAGAVVGPLLALLFLEVAHLRPRTVFLLAAVPGALALLVLVVFVREQVVAPPPAAAPGAPRTRARLGARLWWFYAALVLFTLGNSSDAFLLLHAQKRGLALALLPALWLMHHVVKAALSSLGGALSDRVGRRPAILAGWALYALVYLAFGLAAASWQIWLLFAVYGVYFALCEGAEKALVADLAPADARGAAFGVYNFAIGVAALPASLLFGALYQTAGPFAAFATGAACAAAGAVVLLLGAAATR